jgi:type I restriction enzyme S subunit
LNLQATGEIPPSVRRWKVYSSYKDSGSKWLGVIPAHWEVRPLKWAVEYVEGPGIMAADFTVDGVPLIRIASIGGRKATLDGCNYLSPELVARRWEHFRVRCGDLLISGSASTGLCSEVDELTEGAVPYTGIIIVRPRQYTTEKVFVRWFFLCGLFLTQAEIARSGSTIQHFGPSHLSRMLIVLPPLSEQRAIATFLDRETAKIDALVARKERLIALLQEKRAALITRAVTKGLDPSVPMKDSGVEWLGEIPAHWEMKGLRHVTRINQGLQMAQSARFSEPGPNRFEYITIKSIHAGDQGNKEYIENPPRSVICNPEDILLARTGATGEVISGQLGAFHNNFFKVEYDSNQVNRRYLVYYLTNSLIKEHFLLLAGTTTIPDLNHGEFLATPFVGPPIAEQLGIANFLTAKPLKLIPSLPRFVKGSKS